jgi:hypothetical protein
MNTPELLGRNVLFVGAGGGFDIFGAIPLISSFENCFFANYGKHKDSIVREATEEDYPEYGMPGCYVLGRNGVQAVRAGIDYIIGKHPEIDTVMVIDGGVDALMHGDEKDAGTILEDFIVLAAANWAKVPHKYLTCVGFSCESEENLNHYRVLENISQLCKGGHFLGSCSLTKSKEFQKYKEQCQAVWQNKRVSHIQGKIIAAVEGQFGDVEIEGMDAQLVDGQSNGNFLNPLMGMYWFFELSGVIEKNQLVGALDDTTTFTDAMMVLRQNLRPIRGNDRKFMA